MKRKELTKLRNDTKKRNLDWLKEGNKNTFYKCEHCLNLIETIQPQKKMVTSKGFWDSAMVCINCGEINFVRVYPSGKTESFKLGN